MKNPNMGWLKLGIGPKVKCRYGDDRGSGFYGASTGGYWTLNAVNANGLTGEDNEKIRKRINLSHFKDVADGEIDLYVDADQGIFRMCVVGMLSEDKEVEITGLNKSNNEKGWVPRIIFYNKLQSFRIASIDVGLYGQTTKISWG